MSRKKQLGLNFIHLILGIVAVMLVAIIWQQQQISQRRELEAAEQARQEQQRQLEERQRLLEEQKKEFEEKLAAEARKREYDKAIESLDAIYSRWTDAATLADSTARIALSGPVGTLQSIKREAENLIIPECLTAGRASLVDGMNSIIQGFILFMNDATLGKILAQPHFTDGERQIAAYKAATTACGLQDQP